MTVVAKTANSNSVKKKLKKNAKGRVHKRKSYELNLKGWLATPQDWAQFDIWAKQNAKPKKLIVEPPVVRCKKPLICLIPRLKCLARPKKNFGESQCATRYLCVKGLRVKASARLRKLARPRCRSSNICKEWGVSCPALFYNATDNIIKLSQPKKRNEPDDCQLEPCPPQVCDNYVASCRTEALALPRCRPAFECRYRGIPCIDENPPPLSPWMEYLALPSFKMLKDNNSEQAKKMKKRHLTELEVRGKQALEEQRQKDKREEEMRYEEEEQQRQQQQGEEGQSETAKKKWKMRKRELNAWRFSVSKCKPFPPIIAKGALQYQVSDLTNKLAEPMKRKLKTCRKDPYQIKESAKSAQSTPRLNSLAKPKFQLDPVTKDKPRSRDQYDRVIIEKPLAERILPKAKEYPLAECRVTETAEMRKNRLNKERERCQREIDPIASAPTIDPLFDPKGARRQIREREFAKIKLTKYQN